MAMEHLPSERKQRLANLINGMDKLASDRPRGTAGVEGI